MGGEQMEYPVYCAGSPVGNLRVEEEIPWLRLEMRCKENCSGVFRAVLTCRCGEIGLGVLEPKENGLYLCRRVSAAQVASLGGVVRGEMRLSYAFQRQEGWRSMADTSAVVADADLRERLARHEKALWCRNGDKWHVALPWGKGDEFPLCSLFCFARIREVCGHRCAVISFDEQGHPVVIEKSRKAQ